MAITFRPCWILLGGSFGMAIGGLRWTLHGGYTDAGVLSAVCSAALLIYYLIVEGKDEYHVIRKA